MLTAIHPIECAGLDQKFVEYVDVMHLAVGNANEGGDVAAQVEQRMHLHSAFVFAEPNPREDRQT